LLAGWAQAQSNFRPGCLRLPLMLRYTYPRSKVVPIAEAGLSVSYAIRAKSTAEQFNYRGDANPLPFMPDSGGAFFRTAQTGLGVGLVIETHGAGGRALALLLRAEIADGFSPGGEVGTTVTHFYGLLSFDLTK